MSKVAPTAFGDLLRQHRLAAALTQESLAERAGLSVHGIQRLEGAGTHPYRETVRRLMLALRLSPEEAVAFQAAGQPAPRHRGQGAATSSAHVPHDLPAALTSFIGRAREMDEIAQLLPTARLLTLTGVGGCGKTRLAVELARLMCDSYPDSVWLVELASVADPALVPQAVATALGVRETPTQPLLTTLTTALKQRQLLLVLDNCEHLLDACAQLANALLQACPGLQILATSREALGLSGEVSRRVLSLPVPPLDPPLPFPRLRDYAGVQLFVERVGAVQPGFAVTDRNAAAIAQVCSRLDGIPLALELAAARVRGLSVEDLATRLDQRFRLLTGGSRAALPRQQTLRATIDWSFELLTPHERALFTRLSVFAGSWAVEAAEAVGADAGGEQEGALELLLRLVDKSLVVAEEDAGGTQRYRLLDTLRQYGRERLLASGLAEVVHGQHASYYLALAERAEPELDQPRQAAWIQRLELEQSDLRAALEWLMARGEIQEALRLAGVLSRFWEVRGYLREGRARLATLLALPGASAPTLPRAKVLDGAGVLALYQFDLTTARGLFKESLALYRRHQHSRGAAWVLIHLGWLGHDMYRFKAARRFLREALALCRQVGDRRGIARSLTLLGNVAFFEGDLITARSLHEQGLALNREVGDRWGTAWALNNLGLDLLVQAELGQADPQSAHVVLLESREIWRELGERRHLAFVNNELGVSAIWQGDLASSRVCLEEALSTFAELNDVMGIWSTIFNCAPLFAAQGRHEHAVRVLGASSALGKAPLGRALPPLLHSLQENRLDSARRLLGTQIVATAWTEGRAMSRDEAIAYTRQHLVVSVLAV